MTSAAELLSQSLTELSAAQRRAQAQYLNVQAFPGQSGPPRRFMSDIGFLSSGGFAYLNPNQANYYYDDTESPRDILQIILVPYGIEADFQRLTSSAPRDRLVHAVGAGTGGVSPHPEDDRFLMSGTLNARLYSEAKQTAAVRRITSRTGPATHFIVNREGGVSIGPSVDAITSAVPDFSDTAVFVAVESALMILAADHTQRRFDRILEQPLTSPQVVQLAVLLNKLFTAFGSNFPRAFSSSLTPAQAGLRYEFPTSPQQIAAGNFIQTPPTQPVENPRISYAFTTPVNFFNTVAQQGPYELATDIWRPFASPTPASTREEARSAMAQLTTAGEETALMGNYVTVAAGDRSTEMQTVIRRQVFVQRQRVAQQTEENAANQAADAAASTLSTTLPNENVLQTDPHSYDFSTGLWGAPDPVLGTRNV